MFSLQYNLLVDEAIRVSSDAKSNWCQHWKIHRFSCGRVWEQLYLKGKTVLSEVFEHNKTAIYVSTKVVLESHEMSEKTDWGAEKGLCLRRDNSSSHIIYF